jgi:hypothetical protein
MARKLKAQEANVFSHALASDPVPVSPETELLLRFLADWAMREAQGSDWAGRLEESPQDGSRPPFP